MRRFRDRVHVGTTLTTMIYRLPPILRRVRLDHPGVDLVVTNAPTRNSVENIIQNRVDLALVNLPVEKRQLKITPLYPEVLVAIFPVGTRGVQTRSRRAILRGRICWWSKRPARLTRSSWSGYLGMRRRRERRRPLGRSRR